MRERLPVGYRDYTEGTHALRHTVGISLSEAGADLSDVQAHLGHKQLSTTRRHYVPVLGSRMQRLSESIEGRFQWPEEAVTARGPTAPQA